MNTYLYIMLEYERTLIFESGGYWISVWRIVTICKVEMTVEVTSVF